MDYARSTWILLHIKVGLSPILLMTLYLTLNYYKCIVTTLSCHFPNIEVESNNVSHLESLDALRPGRRILKENVHALVDCQTVTNYSAIFSLNTNKYVFEFIQ